MSYRPAEMKILRINLFNCGMKLLVSSLLLWTWFIVLCCATSLKTIVIPSPQKIVNNNEPKVLAETHLNSFTTSLVIPDVAKLSSDPCGDSKSYEAIKTLHRQLDDDADGGIDLEESDEFLRDELNYEKGDERHKEFHGNDKFISVDELWEAWKISQVHNWTVQETVDWLLASAELPEYEHNFRNNGVDGTCLPRLAINSNSLLSGRLGIKDAIHRQKIALKAMEVVLFGETKRHNFLKDAILALSLVIATGGCWFAYVQHKYSQVHLQKTMKDMEALQKAEDALYDMQKQLYRARQAQEIVNIEKQDLERRLQDEIKTSYKGKSLSGNDQHRVKQLEEQLRCVQSSLLEAERRLGSHMWLPPPSLQHWLQLTHELELRNYNSKKSVAEQQLQAAKDACEKLSRKRSTLLGAFRIAHGDSIDDVDDRIMQAKSALSEVTSDLQERMYRWKQIERLCSFPIIQNPGLTFLETLLKPPTSVNGSASSFHSGVLTLTRSSSEGNLVHDESPPPYAAGINIVNKLVHNSSTVFPMCSVGISSARNYNMQKRRYLCHQDSGISLTSLGQITVNNPPKYGLANIPPPIYTKSSPAYTRKMASIVPPDILHGSVVVSSSMIDEPYHQTRDIITLEDDDQLADLEDDRTERSQTPQSCSSCSGYSDAGRTPFTICDGSEDWSHIIAHDTDDQLNIETLSQDHEKVQLQKTAKKGKKPPIAIVTALKGSFNTSTTSVGSPSEEKKKKKKKSIFNFRRKKTE